VDRTRKASREANEITLHHRTKGESLGLEEIALEKLIALQKRIEQAMQTPHGKADLARRIKSFGECTRGDQETTTQYYDRLRHWLTLTIPQTKAPLHPPRQNDGLSKSEDL
jgi:hypothetical protein